MWSRYTLKNPYIIDRPLTDQDLFFGREAQLSRLSELLDAGKRFFLLYGKHHIGKTSFLNQLPKHLGSRYTIRRIEGLTSENAASSELLRIVADGMIRAFDRPVTDQVHDTNAEARIRDLLQSLNPSEDTTHLFCLDALSPTTFPTKDEWREALDRLRAALDGISNLAVLVAIEAGPREIGLQADPAGWIPITIGPLQEEETEELLISPVRGVLTWDYEAVRYIHRLTGGHPLLVQRFGHLIYDQRAQAGWAGIADVERAIDHVLTQSSPEFDRLWGSLSSATQIVLCAFAEMMSYYHGVGTSQDISLYLARLGAYMPQEDIAHALDELVAQEVLQRLGGDTFRFTNELIRRWLQRYHNTIETALRAHDYRRIRIRRVAAPRRMRIDWVGILLWLVAGVLALLIAFVWRSRQKGIVFLTEPTSPTAPEHATAAPAIAPVTPETGISRGRIVYMARENPASNWQIYSMRSDGSDPIRLTHNEHNDTSPAWSPDGRKIAFVSDRDGNREIYVMNADGNEQINLTLHPADDWAPAWSPDGKRIAFASFRDGDWEIYVMNANGSNPVRLTKSKGIDSQPAWSPDGQRIAFVSDRDGNLEIYVMAADGSGVVRMTHHEATDQSPTWSPDGRQLLWESYRDNNMEIYAVDIDGNNLRNITQEPRADDRGPTFSPWGRRIAFFSNRDGGWDIYTLDLETGVRTNLTLSSVQEQAPNWGR